jgi:hypothetical protein
MPSSQVQIANMALDVIGTRSSIQSLTEGSNEANAISRHYDNAVDSTLRACHWNFARKQIPLTLLQDGTNGGVVPTPWLYEYAYPSDCVLMRQLVPQIMAGGVSPASVGATTSSVVCASMYGPPVRFQIGTDLDINGNPISVLLTNQPQAIGIYTFRNTNTAMWDPLFVQAFAAYLGSRVCMTLTGDKTTMRMALSEAQQYATDAQRSNGNEGLTVIETTPDWMRVRGYASDWAWPDGGMFSYGPQQFSLVG